MDVFSSQHHGGEYPMNERDNDPKFIEIEHRLRSIISEMDDDFLERVTNAEWGDGSQSSHWFDAVLQMMYSTIASYGVAVDEFFGDWLCEPHNCYLLREYEKRKRNGVYPAKKYDGMNRNFNRSEYYGMHGMNSKK